MKWKERTKEFKQKYINLEEQPSVRYTQSFHGIWKFRNYHILFCTNIDISARNSWRSLTFISHTAVKKNRFARNDENICTRWDASILATKCQLNTEVLLYVRYPREKSRVNVNYFYHILLQYIFQEVKFPILHVPKRCPPYSKLFKNQSLYIVYEGKLYDTQM